MDFPRIGVPGTVLDLYYCITNHPKLISEKTINICKLTVSLGEEFKWFSRVLLTQDVAEAALI